MSYLGEFEISSAVPFNFQALDGFGEATDADQAPTYEVYVNNSPMDPAHAGVMAKIAGQTGFYGGSVAATAANGFAAGNTYTIRISAVIAGVVTLTTHTFRLLANAATTVSATFTRPALEDNQVPVEANNPYDAALINASRWDMELFGESVVLVGPDGTERSVTAVVTRSPIADLGGGMGTSHRLEVSLLNNAICGLSAAEFDKNQWQIRVAVKAGGAASQRTISDIIEQDAAIVRYGVA